MKVLAHLDPWVLERELLTRIDRAHPRQLPAATLVVVPTTRLVDHLQRRLTEQRAAWIGVDVLNFRSLALRIVEAEARTGVRVASSRLLEALLRRLLREQPGNFWTGFVGSRPGAIRRLRGTLNDLREAGIDPQQVDAVCGTGVRPRGLAQLYRAYVAALEGGHDGWTDETGLVRAAAAHAERHARRWGAVFLHGAYEWIGVHVELIHALDRGSNLTALVPALPGAPAADHSLEFARRYLLAGKGQVEALADPLPIEQRPALGSLYDEACHPPPARPGQFVFRHTQGESAEVAAAVRWAMRAVADGCQPCELAVVARSLEPFGPALEEALDDERIPWTSSLSEPLRRQPLVRDFLIMLRAVSEDLPRAPTAALLRSPRVRWERLLAPGQRPSGSRAEVWSRKARLLGGLEEWTRDLPAWAERPDPRTSERDDDPDAERRRARERSEQAQTIARALESLVRRVAPAARRWSDHAARLRGLLRELFPTPDTGTATVASEQLHAVIDEMALLEPFAGDTRSVTFGEMCDWLETAVDGSEISPRRPDNGGIRVLDAMQLRGLTFERLYVIGMNSGLFPRAPREDPVLDDALRRRLRDLSGRPLPVKSDGNSEEHLLLALLLGAARQGVEISWQRADEAGRAKTPSLALREIARVAFGRPTLQLPRTTVLHLPSDPRRWLDTLLSECGLLTRAEERVLAALRAADARDLESLGRRFPELADGVAMLRATQSFEIVDPRYDGRIGSREPLAGVSVSALNSLGRCPLRFFFGHVLRVRELDEQPSVLEITPRDLGTGVHELLEAVYRRLLEDGHFGRDDADALERAALEQLERERGRLLGDLDARLARRLPVLHRSLSESWLQAVRDFAVEDLARLSAAGATPESLESDVVRELDFGEGLSATIRGRFDRISRDARGPIVGDYKTSGDLERQVDPAKMLSASELQVPLYRVLAGGDARVELLGVGPTFADDARRFPFEGFGDEVRESGFAETMRVLLRLRRDGIYPLHHDPQACSWCPFESACRHQHPPTRDREDAGSDARDYRAVRRKNTRRPDLASVGDAP